MRHPMAAFLHFSFLISHFSIAGPLGDGLVRCNDVHPCCLKPPKGGLGVRGEVVGGRDHRRGAIAYDVYFACGCRVL